MPSFFEAPEPPERDFQEWVDAFWAKDVQELFRLERRRSFQHFLELLLMQSGGIFEASRFARPCEVSRTTIANYLSVLEATYVIHVVRPFSSHRATEIVSAPRVYGFDTGFVCHYRDWREIRTEDLGLLWEHYVLNELHATLQTRDIRYWRDKRGHEVDFVISRRSKAVGIECKWSLAAFEPAGLAAFHRQYPEAELLVVHQDSDRPFNRPFGDLTVTCLGLADLVDRLR
jgi:hypothetical protein